jgi:hypothetical protein
MSTKSSPSSSLSTSQKIKKSGNSASPSEGHLSSMEFSSPKQHETLGTPELKHTVELPRTGSEKTLTWHDDEEDMEL